MKRLLPNRSRLRWLVWGRWTVLHRVRAYFGFGWYQTAKGNWINDADCIVLAREAERGYPLSHVKEVQHGRGQGPGG